MFNNDLRGILTADGEGISAEFNFDRITERREFTDHKFGAGRKAESHQPLPQGSVAADGNNRAALVRHEFIQFACHMFQDLSDIFGVINNKS